MRAWALALLVGCGGGGESPTAEATAVPAPQAPAEVLCAVAGTLVDGQGVPVVGRSVTALASRRIDERKSKTVGRVRVDSAVDGRWTAELPCGADLDLQVGGWLWTNAELGLVVSEDPLVMKVSPKLKATLGAVDRTGKALPATFESAYDGSVTPIPVEGLEVIGFEAASPAGTIHVDGFPPRPWTFQRSDTVEAHHQGDYDVEVIFGPGAARWLLLGAFHKDVKGAWCIADGKRGDKCKLEPSAIRCPCDGPIAVAGPWDVAWMVPLPAVENTVEVPPIEERCLPGTRARPAGVDGGLVLEATYAAGDCIRVVTGQQVDTE